MTNEEHKQLLAALPEPVREAREALPVEAAELLDYPRDLNDAAHEHADGAAEVIYHYQAHKLLANCTSDERDAAEQEMEDTGSPPETYDAMASLLAYFVVRARYVDEVREALEAYRETVQAEREALEANGAVDDEPPMEAIERDLSAIEAVLG